MKIFCIFDFHSCLVKKIGLVMVIVRKHWNHAIKNSEQITLLFFLSHIFSFPVILTIIKQFLVSSAVVVCSECLTTHSGFIFIKKLLA